MKPNLSVYAKNLLHFTITVQVLVASWFIFSPDLVPASIREAERLNDQLLYEHLDNIIVPLVYTQNLLCMALWWPTSLASWAYFLVTAAIAVLGSFAGPTILSSIDGTLDSLQTLAAGAMLCILYLGKFFSWPKSTG